MDCGGGITGVLRGGTGGLHPQEAANTCPGFLHDLGGVELSIRIQWCRQNWGGFWGRGGANRGGRAGRRDGERRAPGRLGGTAKTLP